MKNPKYKIGDIVIIKKDKDSRGIKYIQGRIFLAEFYTAQENNKWFYGIEAMYSTHLKDYDKFYKYEFEITPLSKLDGE